MNHAMLTGSAVLLIGSMGVFAATVPEDIKEAAKKRVDERYTVGMAVGVIDGDQRDYFFAGNLAADDDRNLDEQTLFEIGSITKVFTSILLADAAQRGEVKFKDPVQSLLPSGHHVPQRGGKSITLQDLACHRSGLPRLPSNMMVDDMSDPFDNYTPDKLYEFLNEYELPRDIGAEYEYSNLGFGVLGHALSVRLGDTYESLLVKRVCSPLHLRNTRITLTPEMKKRLAAGHASDAKTQVENWSFDCLAGCGALRSNVADILTFLSANIDPPKNRLGDAIRRTHRGRYPAGSRGMTVALGWHVLNRHGVEVIWHNGGTGGYRSFCGFEPKTGKGIVVLSNSAHDVDDLGLHYFSNDFELQNMRTSLAVAAHRLDDFLGYYKLSIGLMLHVTKRDDQLFVQLSGQAAFPIYPEAKDRFFYKVVDAQVSFHRNDEGTVVSLTLHQNGIDQAAERLPADFKPVERKEMRVDPKVLQRYVGRYQLQPGVIFDVRLNEGQLTVQLTGQPAFPIFAETETSFFLKVVDAQITFVVDENGQISELILHQMGMDQNARRLN